MAQVPKYLSEILIAFKEFKGTGARYQLDCVILATDRTLAAYLASSEGNFVGVSLPAKTGFFKVAPKEGNGDNLLIDLSDGCMDMTGVSTDELNTIRFLMEIAFHTNDKKVVVLLPSRLVAPAIQDMKYIHMNQHLDYKNMYCVARKKQLVIAKPLNL